MVLHSGKRSRSSALGTSMPPGASSTAADSMPCSARRSRSSRKGSSASYDAARYGFEDLQFYRELTFPADRRLLPEDAAEDHLRQDAAAVLRSWAEQLPFDAEPKF